jgi:hypothetical protein
MDYNNGKIYKIVSNITDDVYFGSTTQKLSKRIWSHRADYKMYLQGKRCYISSFKILETGYYDIILVENFPCRTKEELHARERFYIENNNCINKNIPCRTDAEYRQDNKERYKDYRKENKDMIAEYHKKWYLNNKDLHNQKKKEKIICDKCGSQIRKADLPRHKRSIKCQNS